MALTQEEKKALFEEAFRLLKRAGDLLLAVRIKHEQKVKEMARES